jgi:hypothetical protein
MTTPEDRDIWERDEEALRDEVRQLNATLDRASRDTIQQAREYRALVAERDELRAEVERLRYDVAANWVPRPWMDRAKNAEALHVVAVNPTDWASDWCSGCGRAWPCPTIAALADAPAEQRAEGGA